MKTDLFHSYGHCWVFQICWHIECSTWTVLSFGIWNSSAGIPSPSLALSEVMLPKVHLTSCSRMSGSRWMVTPLWLSESLRSYLHSFPVYSCQLFLIPSASVRSIPFLSFIVSILAWSIPFSQFSRSVMLTLRNQCYLGISNFLEEISVFPILMFSSISLHCSLKKALLSLLAILWNSAFRWVYLSFSSAFHLSPNYKEGKQPNLSAQNWIKYLIQWPYWAGGLAAVHGVAKSLTQLSDWPKLNWVWPCQPKQDPVSPQPFPPIRKLAQTSFPHPSEGRQNENWNHRKLTKLIAMDHTLA